MSDVQKIRIASHCVQKIEEFGLTVRECDDFDQIPAILEKMEKPYFTPYLSPQFNDFSRSSGFWLIVEKDGIPVAVGGARFDDLKDEKIDSYWARTFKRHYGDSERPQIHSIAQPLVNELGGKLAYFGDLFVAKGARGSRSILSYAMTLCHILVSMKWSPDWTYAFLHEKDVRRGAAYLYGFTRTITYSKMFFDPQKPRNNSECCVLLSKDDLDHFVRTYQFDQSSSE